MAMKHLLTKLACRRSVKASPVLTQAVRSSFSSPVVASSLSTPPPMPPPQTAMVYDCLTEDVKSKIQRLDNPEPPHPTLTLTDPSHILTALKTRVTVLPKGLRVAMESNLAANIATVSVWIDSRSRFENDENNGMAHFLEHMIFKGTWLTL